MDKYPIITTSTHKGNEVRYIYIYILCIYCYEIIDSVFLITDTFVIVKNIEQSINDSSYKEMKSKYMKNEMLI